MNTLLNLKYKEFICHCNHDYFSLSCLGFYFISLQLLINYEESRSTQFIIQNNLLIILNLI